MKVDRCPKCASEHIEQDAVDIGVGTQYGPATCADCGWSERETAIDPLEADTAASALWTAGFDHGDKGRSKLARKLDVKYHDNRGTRAAQITRQFFEGADQLDAGELGMACIMLADSLPLVMMHVMRTLLDGDLSDPVRRRQLDMLASAAHEWSQLTMASGEHITKTALALDRFANVAADALRDKPATKPH